MDFSEFFKYHQDTKHSYFSVRNYPNRLSWENQPKVFKTYEMYEKYELNIDILNHSFLYYIAGLNAKKTYPGVEYYLRMNPSAGALYPNEIYFQSRNNENIKDGIYHFDIVNMSITLLCLIENNGIEKDIGIDSQVDGFIFFISSLYYRSSWKYKNRAFRYCLLDGGHILGSLEASCYLHDKSYTILYDFDKKFLNKKFGFNNEEFFQSCIIVGDITSKEVTTVDLNIKYVDGTYFFEENEVIQNAYKDSLKIIEAKKEKSKPSFYYDKDRFKNTIFKRRSIRDFSKQPIKKEEFFKILNILNEPIPSDCDEKLDIYCVINRVKGMPLGLFKSIDYIKKGDFINQAGYLCLEQDLGKDSAVTFFITSKAKNYQALYQKAGLIGHRLYLAANYLGYGCSGIGAYYDDEVCTFLEDNTMVLYALAIGN
ncbi:dehydrogenase [Malaciobacter molluscorum LMG 25693]|uniref:Dehydrogenase n=1 Tax=Malaciobacter molluscorum LMG 25693 TaxID=870501 RepID=A0A2G1DIG9_9BACT|nr:SagB family peptide dehydrogenase [Malaciobacter molluscorum]AXX91907.1 putative McbC-like oxidoreductase [Malaciobacter molluscorum LMG 25693]PHO18309.1 dehydrogenase [Malaciobacter molluscorum LMG 25693]